MFGASSFCWWVVMEIFDLSHEIRPFPTPFIIHPINSLKWKKILFRWICDFMSLNMKSVVGSRRYICICVSMSMCLCIFIYFYCWANERNIKHSIIILWSLGTITSSLSSIDCVSKTLEHSNNERIRNLNKIKWVAWKKINVPISFLCFWRNFHCLETATVTATAQKQKTN